MQKRRNTLRFIGRVLIIWAIEFLGLLFMVWLLPGVRVDSLATADQRGRGFRGVDRQPRWAGRRQTQPFLLFPAAWQVDHEEILGAEKLFEVLKGWVSEPAQA